MARQREREQQIFEAAYRVLEEKGYKGASMLAIAKAASASNETLYAWYGNKQGLLAAMIRANAEEAAGTLSRLATGKSGDDPVQRLRRCGEKLLSLLTDERAVALGRAAAADVAEDGELGRLLAEHGRGRLVPVIVETIREAQVQGALKPHDPLEVAEIFLAMLLGDVQFRRVTGVTRSPPQDAIAGHAQRVIELLLDIFGTDKD